MPIEINTLQQILHLSPNDIMDLIDTVGHAAQLNRPLLSSPKDKILIAFAMLNHANSMLEQCSCKIDLKVTHPTWDTEVLYNTPQGKISDDFTSDDRKDIS